MVLEISEPTIPNKMFKKGFELGKRVLPYLAGTVPNFEFMAVVVAQY